MRQIERILEADVGRRQHRPHRSRINPAIGVPAHALVDRAVIHARTAADAAQHLLHVGADQLGAAPIEQDDVKVRRAIRLGIDVDAIIAGAYSGTVARAKTLLAHY